MEAEARRHGHGRAAGARRREASRPIPDGPRRCPTPARGSRRRRACRAGTRSPPRIAAPRSTQAQRALRRARRAAGRRARRSRAEFAAVYAGEGRNAPEDAAVSGSSRSAAGLALFAVTVGEALTARDPAALRRATSSRWLRCSTRSPRRAPTSCRPARRGALARRAAARRGADGAARAALQPRLLRLARQRAAAALRRAPARGDRHHACNDSCLMQPLKSVSGVLVAGPGAIHGFAADYPFCAECRTRECRRRMASVLEG